MSPAHPRIPIGHTHKVNATSDSTGALQTEVFVTVAQGGRCYGLVFSSLQSLSSCPSPCVLPPLHDPRATRSSSGFYAIGSGAFALILLASIVADYFAGFLA